MLFSMTGSASVELGRLTTINTRGREGTNRVDGAVEEQTVSKHSFISSGEVGDNKGLNPKYDGRDMSEA